MVIHEHCDRAICETTRPDGWKRNASLFSRAHGGRHGGHIYLGPCKCNCDACLMARKQKVPRLEGGD
jgi:hypothetical protein